MKKIMLCLFLSALFGVCLGIYSFKLFNKEDIKVSSNRDVYAIQVGVFESLDNANKLASKYGAIVVMDNNRYRVYVSIVSNCLKLIEEYYDGLGVAYYVRTISVQSEFYNYLIDKEKEFNSSNKNMYESINNTILKKYMEEL